MNKKIFFVLFLLSGIQAMCLAQDVNGLQAGVRYTRKQVEAALGKPDKYLCHDSEFGLDEEYQYGKSTFRFGQDGILVSFYVADRKFKVLSKMMKEGVKVGDRLSVLDNFVYGAPVPAIKKNKYVIPLPGDDVLTVDAEKGIIRSFCYTLPM